MLTFLFNCINRFGLFSGLAVYVRIKILKSSSFFIPELKYPIYYRPGTVDVSTFREIFLREEYAINLPSRIKPTVIIDAGANIGFTTLFFIKRYPTATLFSLEPDSKNFELLKKNTSHYPAIVPIQKALWHKVGSIEIVDEGHGLRGFTVKEARESSTALPATTLRTLLQENKITSIDILKMDIEGSEKEVFEADTSWLAITKCLIIELHDRMKPGCSKAVFKALATHNFECSIKGENLVFINQDLDAQQ